MVLKKCAGRFGSFHFATRFNPSQTRNFLPWLRCEKDKVALIEALVFYSKEMLLHFE